MMKEVKKIITVKNKNSCLIRHVTKAAKYPSAAFSHDCYFFPFACVHAPLSILLSLSLSYSRERTPSGADKERFSF